MTLFSSFIPEFTEPSHRVHVHLNQALNVDARDYCFFLCPVTRSLQVRGPRPVPFARHMKDDPKLVSGEFTLKVVLNPHKNSQGREIFLFGYDEIFTFAKRLLKSLAGFEMVEGSLQQLPLICVDSPNKSRPFPLNFWEVQATGSISDEALFREAYRTGIGSRKVYGAGMIRIP